MLSSKLSKHVIIKYNNNGITSQLPSSSGNSTNVSSNEEDEDVAISATGTNGVNRSNGVEINYSATTNNDNDSNNNNNDKTTNQDIYDTEAIRQDIQLLYTFKLEEEDKWRQTTNRISIGLNRLKARWRELEKIRKGMRRANNSNSSSIINPARRSKRQKTDYS